MNIFDRIKEQIGRVVYPLFLDSDAPEAATITQALRVAVIDAVTKGIWVHVKNSSLTVQTPETGTVFKFQKLDVPIVSTVLPDVSYPRGFVLTNLGTETLYVTQQDATATLTAYEIGPGRERTFGLPNSNLLKARALETTTKIQIGGVE